MNQTPQSLFEGGGRWFEVYQEGDGWRIWAGGEPTEFWHMGLGPANDQAAAMARVAERKREREDIAARYRGNSQFGMF